ncbi:MAG: aldehyde ferredoxin oxidoreductase C-terminal domain-containing protein, partial [Pseudomonadota bacterium]
AVTGFETTIEDLRHAARRNWHLLKALNVRLGFSRKDDIFPERWFDPLVTTDRGTLTLQDYFGTSLTREDCEKLLDDYYDERGWDIETGIPTEQTLKAYDLEEVAEDLKKKKFIR